MTDKRYQWDEDACGAGHPTVTDNINRLALVEHNNDGTHNKMTQVKDPYIDVRAYGADPTGVSDSTTAFQNAVNYAYTVNNRTVLVPHGQYRMNGTVTITQGVMLVCVGSQGSTQQYGTTFIQYSTGDLFVWNGNGTANAGTGGGLKNCLILKADTYSGGDAIKLLATDDSHRPGEMVIENVLVYGTGTGLWARALHIDGTACVTAGSKGVRTVVLHKFRGADCTTNNQYIYINQGVHISGNHVQIDTGHGTGTCGMTIAGDSENINISNLMINGNFIINDNATHVNMNGKVSALNVSGTSVIGTASISTTNQILNSSKNFKIAASNYKPAFLGVRTTAATNVTGNGTSYTVLYDSETFDKNGDFNPATGIFTANVAGTYQFNAGILYSNLGVGHVRTDTTLDHKNSGGTTLGSYASVENPYAKSASGNATTIVSPVTVDMAKGDTMRFVANVSGSTLTVNAYGSASIIYTYFSGELL